MYDEFHVDCVGKTVLGRVWFFTFYNARWNTVIKTNTDWNELERRNWNAVVPPAKNEHGFKRIKTDFNALSRFR